MEIIRDKLGRFVKGKPSYQSQFRTEIICEICKKTFLVPNWIAKSGRKYCSRKCFLQIIGKCNNGLERSESLRKKISIGMNKAFLEGRKSKIHCKSFKKGQIAWNYIDGRSKNPEPRKIKVINGKNIPMSYFVWCSQQENLPYVPKGFVIHHLNGNGHDNNQSNLILMPDKLHRSWHMQAIKQLKRGF